MGEQNVLSPGFGTSIIFIVISWLVIFWMLGDFLMTAGLLLLIAAGTGLAQVFMGRSKRGVTIKDAFWAETYSMLITLGLLMLLAMLVTRIQPLLTYQAVLLFVFPLMLVHSVLSRWLRKFFSGQETSWHHEIGLGVAISLTASLLFIITFSVAINVMENNTVEQLSTVPLPTNLDYDLSESIEYLAIQSELANQANELNLKTERIQGLMDDMEDVCLLDCDYTNLLELSPSLVEIIVQYEQLNDASAIAFSMPPEQVRSLTFLKGEYEICSSAYGTYTGLGIDKELIGISARLDSIGDHSPAVRKASSVIQGTLFWTRIGKVSSRVDNAAQGRTELFNALKQKLDSDESDISKRLRYEVLLELLPACQ